MEPELKVGINGRPFCQSEMRGLARHTLELIKGLRQANPEMKIYLYTYGTIHEVYKRELPFATFRETHAKPKILWDLFILPKLLREDGVKIFHSTNNLGVPWDASVRKIVTIHDDLTHRHKTSLKLRNLWGWLNYAVEYWLLRKSQAFISVSRTAADDINRTMGIPYKSIEVIYNGAKAPYSSHEWPRENFYLYVGGLEERKNIPLMLRALELAADQLKRPLRLTMVSPRASATKELLQHPKHPRLQWEILEKVDDANLDKLYGTCKALILPSRYEGFGLPVVEAMQKGTPLIISDIEVFREITDGEAYFFNPYTEDSLVELITKLEREELPLNHFKELNLKTAQRYCWNKMADKTMAVYRRP